MQYINILRNKKLIAVRPIIPDTKVLQHTYSACQVSKLFLVNIGQKFKRQSYVIQGKLKLTAVVRKGILIERLQIQIKFKKTQFSNTHTAIATEKNTLQQINFRNHWYLSHSLVEVYHLV